MNKLKKIIIFTLIFQLIITASLLPAQAAQKNKVAADIAAMAISINYEDYNGRGGEWDVSHGNRRNDMFLCEYPLIVYQGITYIPLTYDNCVLLGLNLEWKDGQIFLSKSTPEKPAMYLKDQSHTRRGKKTIEMAFLPYPLNLCGAEYSDLEYPALFYKNIAYLPLTWKVAHEIMQWDYRVGEKGIELYTDSYYYYSEGDSDFKINKKRDLAASVSEGIPGYTGHGQKQGPLFTVDGEDIYTAHIDIERYRYGYCKIKIDTGEITYLGGDNLYYEE